MGRKLDPKWKLPTVDECETLGRIAAELGDTGPAETIVGPERQAAWRRGFRAGVPSAKRADPIPEKIRVAGPDAKYAEYEDLWDNSGATLKLPKKRI